jgi:hypothetical protein
MRNAYNNLVGKSEGKKHLGRPIHGWDDNIRMDLRKTWWGMCGLDASGSG